MSVVDMDRLDRLEAKIDALIDKIDALSRRMERSATARRSGRASETFITDPELRARWEARSARMREAGDFHRDLQEFRRRREESGDPDYGIRQLLDAMDRRDPL